MRNLPNLRRWGEEWGGALDMARHWKIECLVRDSIYAIARYMPSPVHPSVRPSVCLSIRYTDGSVKDGWS